GIADQFLFMGDREARSYIKRFDAFAIPSRYESFSYVLAEAMLAGVPPITTEVGGVAEAVRDGENGFVVPHGDAKAMGAAIEALVRQPELRRRMAAAALANSGAFTAERMADKMERLYLDLARDQVRQTGSASAQVTL
ncbi:MAG: glycosyltransferase family 4 protein, partial [Caulobacterales bacterium]|nr:glycosyltransferase family 4 protein [Caulobacterales bacterium]